MPGIEAVNLTEVEFYFREQPWKRVIHKADDIFRLIELAEIQWPHKLEDIVRATFRVKFWRAKRPRRMTIVPCNKALYGRDGDSTILEKLLEARGFIASDAPSVLRRMCA